MISIGEPITAGGAADYFKIDLKNQISDEDEYIVLGLKTIKSLNEKPGSFNDVKNKNFRDASRFILGRTFSRWEGKLAGEFGLRGKVTEKQFNRLCRGQHPQTGEQLIKHVKSRTKTKANGKIIQTKTHRAGLDQTINAPKSVSLVAMKDIRVINAHYEAAFKAIKVAEEFTDAKKGNINPPEKTGKALYAVFLHFDARPDKKDGKVSPSMHFHFFQLNLTKTAEGKYRSLDMRENYRSQKLVTAVYRSELNKNLTALGYEVQINKKTRAPEIKGISRNFIEANSPRQKEIIEKALELKIRSTKIVAANYRRKKKLDKSEMIRKFEELEAKFGYQVTAAVQKAKTNTSNLNRQQNINLNAETRENIVQNKKSKVVEAMDHAIKKAEIIKESKEKKRKVVSRQSIIADALDFAPTEISLNDIKSDFSKRHERGELDKFDIFRRYKLPSNKQFDPKQTINQASKITITNQNESIKDNKTDEKKDEPNSAAFPIQHFYSNDSSRTESRTEFNELQLISAEIKSTGSSPQPFATNPQSRKSNFTEIDQTATKESNLATEIFPLDEEIRSGSGMGFEKIENAGTFLSESESTRADDQTIKGRRISTSDNSRGNSLKKGDGRNNLLVNRIGKNRISGKTYFEEEFELTNSKSQIEKTDGGNRSRQSEDQREKPNRENSDIRYFIEKYRNRIQGEVQNQRFFSSGIIDSKERSKSENSSKTELGKYELEEKSTIPPSDVGRRAKKSYLSREKNRTPVGMGNNTHEGGNSGCDVGNDCDFLPLYDDSRSERGSKNSTNREQPTTKRSGTNEVRKTTKSNEFFEYNNDSENSVSTSGKIVQPTAREATRINSETYKAENRDRAEKTAQLINVTFFSGQLDNRIIKEWTATIEKVSTEQYLNEIIERSDTDLQKTAELIGKQACVFAEKFDLPTPEPQTELNKNSLADKLTEIEIKNFENSTGGRIIDKTFEVLSRQNSLLSTKSISANHNDEINEIFAGLSAAPQFETELEAKTFIALNYPESIGFSEDTINRIQETVKQNESTARETARLIQIAYGGQTDVFTDGFQSALVDEIYYDPAETSTIYNFVAQSNWQTTVDIFSPILQNLDEQNNQNLITPQSDQERNELLTDYVSRQLIETFELKNNPLNDLIKNSLLNNLEKSSDLSITTVQSDYINYQKTPYDLKAPEFENKLEAEAYILSQDDEKKIERSESIVTETEAQVKTESQAPIEIKMEVSQGLAL